MNELIGKLTVRYIDYYGQRWICAADLQAGMPEDQLVDRLAPRRIKRPREKTLRVVTNEDIHAKILRIVDVAGAPTTRTLRQYVNHKMIPAARLQECLDELVEQGRLERRQATPRTVCYARPAADH